MWRIATATAARSLARAASLAGAPPRISGSSAGAAVAASSAAPARHLLLRNFTASPLPRHATPPPSSSPSSVEARKEARRAAEAANALAAVGRGGSEITDQIPVRPVGVVEGASYTVVIVAGVACAAAVLYAAASELLLQPKEYAAFAAALDRVREDPRLTVRLGSPITGYGQEARSRAARQRISHTSRLDGAGVEHITVQFWARGPAGVARVTAEMHKAASGGSGGGGGSGSGSGGGDAFSAPSSSSASADVDGAYGASDWRYDYMVADVDAPSPQRIVIVAPRPAVGGVGAVPAGGGMRGGPSPRLSF